MNYTVIWLRSLTPALTELYIRARADGAAEAVTRATAAIDRALETYPDLRGESRPGGHRLLFELPLSVRFEVHEDARAVIVTRVRYHPPRPR